MIFKLILEQKVRKINEKVHVHIDSCDIKWDIKYNMAKK